MKRANITTLRAELSQILDAVREGEEFEILERHVPVARLIPVGPGTAGLKGKLPPWLEQRRRVGVVRVGNLRPVTEILKGFSSRTPVLGTQAIQAILDERGAER